MSINTQTTLTTNTAKTNELKEQMFSCIDEILNRKEVTSIPKQDHAQRLKTIFKLLEPVNVDIFEAINYLEKYFNFSSLKSEISLNPLIINVASFYKEVNHLDHYVSDDVTSKIRGKRSVSIDGNRFKINFLAISDKGTKECKPINIGRFCNATGKKYSADEFKVIKNYSKFDINSCNVLFNLNYHFRPFIKKVAMLLISGIVDYKEVDLERLFTFEEYLDTSKTQFDDLLPREIGVLTALRKYIYDKAIEKSIAIAFNFATYKNRNRQAVAQDLDQNIAKLQTKSTKSTNNRQAISEHKDLSLVSSLNYGGIYLVQQFLLNTGIYKVFLKFLKEREIALLIELVTQTIMEKYRVEHLSLNKNNFSISGLTSTSNVTELAYKLDKDDLFATLENHITNIFLEKAKENNERISILLDSTIVFCDGKEIIAHKDTYAKDRGFGRGIKAVLLLTECGMPLIFNVIKGNEPDVTTIQDLVNKLELDLNMPKELITFVCDAGYFSKDNVIFLMSKGYDVSIVGDSINSTSNLLNNISIDQKLDSEHSCNDETYIEREILLKHYFYAQDLAEFNKNYPQLKADSILTANKSLKAVIIFNLTEYKSEFKDYRTQILQLKHDIQSKNLETVKKALKHPYITKHKLYTVKDLGNNAFTLVRNDKAMTKLESQLGCNIIYSTLTQLSCDHIINLYHNINNTKLQLQLCKKYVSPQKIKTNAKTSLSLKTMVTQLAIGLYNEINNAIFTLATNPYINNSDKDKITSDFKTPRQLIAFIHQDLNIKAIKGIVQYSQLSKITSLSLEALNLPKPSDIKFIQSTYSYKFKKIK